jgi:hypothetical protein
MVTVLAPGLMPGARCPFRRADVNFVVDRRPSADLSSSEVVAVLVQAARVRNIKSVKALHVVYKELFPDMPTERWQEHVIFLKNCVS